MSDDVWRNRGREDEDFGPPLFGDDSDSGTHERPAARKRDKPIVFDDSTGSLPHWTEPPTGEIPRPRSGGADEVRDPTDDLDVWSSFSGQAPVWNDDPVDDTGRQSDDYSDSIRPTSPPPRISTSMSPMQTSAAP